MTATLAGELKGLVPSLCTPFDRDRAIDLEGLARLARFAREAGADAVVCTALAGEVAELTAAERARSVTAVVDALEASLPVVVGVGAAEPSEAERLARDAEHRGAAAVMLPLLGSRDDSPRGHEEALVRVAGAVTIPVMVQDAPAYLGREIGAHVVVRAAQRATNIQHLKVEGGARAVQAARDVVGDGLALWGGDGGRHLLDCVRSGAAGVVPGVEVVDLLALVLKAEAAERSDLADERFRRVLPWLVFAMESLPGYVASAKYALVRRGLLESMATRMAGATLGSAATRLAARHLHVVEQPSHRGLAHGA